MAIFLFFVILVVLILVHEFGHFITAKKFGILVEEFGIGFPPKLFGRKRGETEYTVNLLPFGGFVRIFGEHADEPAEGRDPSRAISAQPRYVQALVLVAGVFCNAILAWLLFTAAFTFGMPATIEDDAREIPADAKLLILSVLANTPAADAGIKPGDAIVSVTSGTDTLSTPTASTTAVFIEAHPGIPLTLTYEREGKQGVAVVTPAAEGEERGHIGVALGFVGTQSFPVHEAAWKALVMTGEVLKEVVVSFGSLILDAFMLDADISQLTGPVGLVGLVGDASSLGFVYLLTFTAFISLNLAVLNLLPFPALDGGRLFLLGIEAIRRKTLAPSVVNTLNTVGFILLIFLMLVVTYQDILRLIR